MARSSPSGRRTRRTRRLLVISIEVVLLFGQVAVSLPLMALTIAASVILYPIERSGGEAALRLPIMVNDAMNRFRLRLAGEPRVLRGDLPTISARR